MRRRTQAEMDQLVAQAGFEKLEQRIDPLGIFTVSLARRNARHEREAKAERPWRRGVAWLLFWPFFFLSYGFCQFLERIEGVTAAVVFDWERHIPFLPWTIVPYWSIDLLYGFPFSCAAAGGPSISTLCDCFRPR